MKGIGEYLNLHATALTVRAKRNKVLASNIANAATPNFKARDIDFQALINKAEGNGPMRATDARHFKVAGVGGSHWTITFGFVDQRLEINITSLEIWCGSIRNI